MVPVVIMGGNKRGNRREHLAPDPQCLQPLGIVVGQYGKLAGAVVQHPHIHALRRLAGQDLQDTAPHKALVHDKILQENEVPRLLQLPQQLGKFCLAGGKIGHCRPAVHRVTATAADISGQSGGARFLLFKVHLRLLLLGDAVLCLLNELGKALFQRPVTDVALGVQVQKGAEHRHHRHDDEPGIFSGRICGAVQQDAHHGHCENDGTA